LGSSLAGIAGQDIRKLGSDPQGSEIIVTSGLEKRHQELPMLRAIRSLILFFLSIAALIGIKVLNLHVLLTILLVIPVALVALISILTFLIGKAPETTEPKSRERDKR
jgi:Kef-type K+ transport system membrane component KefB